MKVEPLGFQDHINVHKFDIEVDPNENLIIFEDTLNPLPLMFHDSLFRNLLDQPTPIFNDVQPIISSNSQGQGSCISHVEGQSVRDMFHLSPLFQNVDLILSSNHESSNLDNLSNDFEPQIQVETFVNHHHEIPVSINTYGGEYLSI